MENKIKLNTLGLPYYGSEEAVINGVSITVKKTIPYEEVFAAIEWCVNHVIDDRTFVSAPIQAVITDIAILKYYTNLDLSTLDVEFGTQQIYELYDIIHGAGVMHFVLDIIDPEQMAFFKTTLDKTITSIMAYRNSAKGIVDTLTENASTNTTTLQEALDLINDPGKREQFNKLLNFYAEDASK